MNRCPRHGRPPHHADALTGRDRWARCERPLTPALRLATGAVHGESVAPTPLLVAGGEGTARPGRRRRRPFYGGRSDAGGGVVERAEVLGGRLGAGELRCGDRQVLSGRARGVGRVADGGAGRRGGVGRAGGDYEPRSESSRRIGVTRQTAQPAIHGLIGTGLLAQAPDPASARTLKCRGHSARARDGMASGKQQRLDGAAFVHGAVALGDLVEGEGQVEDLARVHAAVQDAGDEVRQEPAYGGGAAAQADV
jgi:hypothetical protein